MHATHNLNATQTDCAYAKVDIHNTVVHTEPRYQGLIVLAIMHSALATIITIICRTHIDSLNSKAAIAFAMKNFLYFGLPMKLIFLAFVNTMLALLLWIFGTFGLVAGVFASVASNAGMWALLYIWASVFYWKNEELPEKVRDKRDKLREKIWTTRFPFISHIHSCLRPSLKWTGAALL